MPFGVQVAGLARPDIDTPDLHRQRRRVFGFSTGILGVFVVAGWGDRPPRGFLGWITGFDVKGRYINLPV